MKSHIHAKTISQIQNIEHKITWNSKHISTYGKFMYTYAFKLISTELVLHGAQNRNDARRCAMSPIESSICAMRNGIRGTRLAQACDIRYGLNMCIYIYKYRYTYLYIQIYIYKYIHLYIYKYVNEGGKHLNIKTNRGI